MEVNDNILRKIEAMMRIIKDPAASEGEVQNANNLINMLLIKHNLDMAVVDEYSLKKNLGEVIEETLNLNDYENKNEANWVDKLFWVMCEFNMCRGLLREKRREKYDQGDFLIIGTKTNVEVVVYTTISLINKIRMLEREAYRTYNGPEKRPVFKRGFFHGAVAGLKEKLFRQRQEMEMGNTEVNAQDLRALVRVNGQEVDKFMEGRYNIKYRQTGSGGRSRDGRSQGFEAGRNMDINKGVGNRSNTKYLN